VKRLVMVMYLVVGLLLLGIMANPIETIDKKAEGENRITQFFKPLEEGTYTDARGFKKIAVFAGKEYFHLGKDYCAYKAGKNEDGSLYGTPFYPISNGTVKDLRFEEYPARDPEIWKNSPPKGVGNYVIVDHGNGVIAVYMHLAKVFVREGEWVGTQTSLGEAGDVILHPSDPKMCPHLHLEIRKNGSTSLNVLPNLKYGYVCRDGKTGLTKPLGEEKDVLAWIDANFLDPDAVLTPRGLPQPEIPTIEDWKEYKVGDLYFSVPADWEFILPQENGLVAVSTSDFMDKKHVNLAVGVKELSGAFKDVEPGKWRIVHYGLDGGKIEEPGKTSRTFSIGHMGYLVDSFKIEVAGRSVTVCVLRVAGAEIRPGERIESTNLSFALIEGGKYYSFVFLGSDPSYQRTIFEQLISRVRFLPEYVRPEKPVLVGLVRTGEIKEKDFGFKGAQLFPLFAYGQGKYRSFERDLEKYVDEKTQWLEFVHPNEAQEINYLFEGETFSFYKNGELAGEFKVKPGPYVGSFLIPENILEGEISWKIPESNIEKTDNFIAFSPAVPFHPSGPLTASQLESLKQVINSVLSTAFKRFEADSKQFAESSQYPDIVEVMDLDRDGSPEVYVKTLRENIQKETDGYSKTTLGISLILSWRNNQWVGLLKKYWLFRMEEEDWGKRWRTFIVFYQD